MTVNELSTNTLKASLRGELIQRSDEGYDAARKVYNAMIDKRPALIARCADVADVITTVKFGRENGFLVSIRGGRTQCWVTSTTLPTPLIWQSPAESSPRPAWVDLPWAED